MSKKLLLSLPLLVFLGLAVAFWVALGRDPNYMPSARVGEPLPQFVLSSLQNPETFLTQQDFEGEPALLNVWGTWCPSCIAEHPMLNQLAQQGVTIYGLNYKDERPAAIEYLQRHGNPFQKTVFDEEGTLGLDLGVTGAPETFFLESDGEVAYRHIGVIDQRVWQDELKPVWESLQ